MENSYNYRLGKTSALCRYIHVPTIPSTRESTSSKNSTVNTISTSVGMYNCCLCKVQHPTYLAAAKLRLYQGNPKWNCLNQLYELSLDTRNCGAAQCQDI